MTIQIFQILQYLNFTCCEQSSQDSFTPKISSKKALGRQMTNDMFSCIGDWRFDWAVVTWTAMLLSLDRVHVQHVHAVLHGVVGVVVPGCPHHPRLPIELTKLREELRVEIHSAGCCLGELYTQVCPTVWLIRPSTSRSILLTNNAEKMYPTFS